MISETFIVDVFPLSQLLPEFHFDGITTTFTSITVLNKVTLLTNVCNSISLFLSIYTRLRDEIAHQKLAQQSEFMALLGLGPWVQIQRISDLLIHLEFHVPQMIHLLD